MKRNPYADLGLVVAIATLVVTLLRSFIFGLSWISVVCLALTVGYLVLSAVRRSDSSVVRRATTAYLLLLLLTLVCVILFNKNARPKMHAFEGAAVDTLAEEEFVVVDRDIPVEVFRPDTLAADTLAPDSTYSEEPIPADDSPAPSDSTEVQ